MSKVKICGLSRFEDIEAVNRALPDYIGFVFAPGKRRVDTNRAASLKDGLNPKIEAVGVFVNEDINIVAETFNNRIIDLIQLHGDEDDEYIRRLKNICSYPSRVVKAFGIGAEQMPPLPHFSTAADYLLFDTLSQARGGTGRTFNWSVLKGRYGASYFLAGGLSADNVEKAIDLLNPYCVDVSSGVETNGVKDSAKIEVFVSLVRRKQK